jgi:hypothetical protein
MSIDPEKPTADSDPWQPDAPNSKDKDKGAEQSANDQYHGVYGGSDAPASSGGGSSTPGAIVPDPTLSMDYTTAPDIRPVKQTGGSASSGQVAPSPAFTVDLGQLRTAENNVLAATQQMVIQYSSLLSQVQSDQNSPTMWGQTVGHTPDNSMSMQNMNDKRSDGVSTGDGTTDNEFDQEGVQFAAAMGPAMTAVLAEVAQTIEMIGQFTALLNNAGQTYAQTDYSCVFDVPPAPPKF